MRPGNVKLILTVGLLMWSLSTAVLSDAATFYVNGNIGSNANTCAQAQNPATPKATMRNPTGQTGAFACLSAGDTLIVLSQGAAPHIQDQYVATGAGQVKIPANVTIKGNDSTTTIKVTGGWSLRDSNNGIIWEDLIFDCSSSKSNESCIHIFRQDGGTTQGWRVRRMTFRDCSQNCLYFGPESVGFLVEDLEIANWATGGNGGLAIYGQGSNNTIRRVKAYFTTIQKRDIAAGANSGGIRIACNPTTPQTCSNNTIERNWVNGAKIGIVIGGSGRASNGSGGSGNIVKNNIVVDARMSSIHLYTSQKGTKVYNNTIYGSVGRGIDIPLSNRVESQLRNNIIVNTAVPIDDRGTATVISHNLTTDPLFTDPRVNDFSLRSESPAINAGATLSDVTNDFVGVLRPQGPGYDIGVYEFAGQATVPNAPTHLLVGAP